MSGSELKDLEQEVAWDQAGRKIEAFLQRQRSKDTDARLSQRLANRELECPRCMVEHLEGSFVKTDVYTGWLLYCPDLTGCGFREW